MTFLAHTLFRHCLFFAMSNICIHNHIREGEKLILCYGLNHNVFVNLFSASLPMQITVLITSLMFFSSARVNTFNSTFLPTVKIEFHCNTFLMALFRIVTTEK